MNAANGLVKRRPDAGKPLKATNRRGQRPRARAALGYRTMEAKTMTAHRKAAVHGVAR
ncbi:hypothetical protein I6G56_21000 [Burkholderia humptydooensis]|uniref:Uncharacterized protein n=1 Tax=Burkholderia humptydooensis TaxID=430531 RepID=A0A7T2U7J5_9BURK|nr:MULTISPECIES: hypothetical protein [Burkholderia]AJY38754.1 hypothetical protein BW21_5885 [Burkholderia sp. 2002721687]QPS46959.1 hypothetical protein I6G56_21000 [Burkholderia humptydooensis]